MSDDCLNDGCFRPIAAGKKHDQFLDIPDRPYLSLTTPPPLLTTTTTTTTTGYPQDLLNIIQIPNSGAPCPISITTTTTTTTTQNLFLILGGLACKFNLLSDSLSTIAEGNVGISISPMEDASIFSNITYTNVYSNAAYSFIAFGYFKPPVTGPYIFYTNSNDGSAVWLDTLANSQSGRNATNAIINNGVTSTYTTATKKASMAQPLSATKYYPIRIVHRNSGGANSLSFSWSGPNIPETFNLSDYFYHNPIPSS